MSLRGWPSKEISDFRGAWTRLDGIQARPSRGFIAKNVRFEPGRVKSREGFSVRLAAVPNKIATFHNWITSAFNQVIYFEGADTVKMLNLNGDTVATLFTQAGAGVHVAESGDKAFIATFNSLGHAAGQVRISLPLISAGQIDKAFAPPWVTLPVIADAGDGDVTEGVHRFGYIVETRTGFVGKPSPQPGDVFTPTSFTVAAGGRRLTLSMTANTPADTAFIHPIMTRTDNLDRWYFVPDAQIAVPGGATGWPISVPIDISDERLADSAEEANDHFNALTQSVTGTGPISASGVMTYGKRMVYFANNVVYFSEPDDFQYITEDQHGVQTPGKKRVMTGFQLRGSFYLVGPGWTHEVSDNGDVPATWSSPTEVSSAIGTLAPMGVEWRTAGDYAWVAATAGLYLFDGRYQPRPISYFNTPEWARINWAAAHAVQVRDDYVNQKVYVEAPLDGALAATHLLVWDYARGLTPEDVDFSLDNIGASTLGGIGLVQDPTTLELEFWVGPPAAGSILRRNAEVRTDNGLKIEAEYETGHVIARGDRGKRINRFGGLDVSVEGSGNLAIVVYGIDRIRWLTFSLPVTATPGESFERKFSLVDENVSVRCSAESTGDWFDLYSLTPYWKPFVTNR